MKSNDKIFEMVTDRIVAEMEKGIIPWQKPWNAETEYAVSHTTGREYSFLNQMLLGFRAGEWLTFNQCKAEGGSIKQGEKGLIVVFWQTNWTKTVVDIDDDGNEWKHKVEIKGFPILKYYTVFHIDQCNGIKPKHTVERKEYSNNPIDAAENVVSVYFDRESCTLKTQHGDRAYYRPSTDTVVVPMLNQYENNEEYYSTLFHEMTHSTGHESRLNRLTKDAAFGSENYSREELVAELGAAFMVARLGLKNENAFRNSVAYLQGWLKALKNDKRMLVVAAGKAEAAINYILNGKTKTGE